MNIVEQLYLHMLSSPSQRVHDLINKTHSTGGFQVEAPKTFRGTGTTQFVRPAGMSVEEYNQQMKDIMMSNRTGLQKKIALRNLHRQNPELQTPPRLGPLIEPSPVFNPNPTTGFFDVSKIRGDQNTFVSLDIETDDYRRPISISALKFQYNHLTGKFESVDNYQRFYSTHLQDIKTTGAVHGLTPSVLKSLRRQQKAGYSSVYNEAEMESLRQYFGNSIIVGQNIVPFDLPALFGGRAIPNSTIDTVFAARNVWKGLPNDLDTIFQRMFGKTMAQAGLHHHDANADTIATMMIVQEMAKWKGFTGNAIQHVMKHPVGYHLAQIDSYLNEGEQVIKGNYLTALRGEIGAYMTEQELGIKDAAGRYVGNMGPDLPKSADIHDIPNEAGMTDAELLADAEARANKRRRGRAKPGEYMEVVGDHDKLTAAYQQFAFWKKSALVREIAKARSSEEEKMLLATSGFAREGEGGDSWGILNQARRLRNTRLADAKEERVKNLKRQGLLWDKEDEKAIRAARSFEELSDAIDEVTDSSNAAISMYQKLGQIKPYDINQLIGAAHNQWSGITGAAKGVIPNFVLNPVTRIGNAAFNAVDRSVSPWNAVQRTWNSGIGQAVTGGLTAIAGPAGAGAGMAISGTINAITQIVGNRAQAKVEMAGLAIQNTLNVLGAAISWVATPFQILGRVAKTLIGSFSGLSLGINKFMQNSIGLMSQMGNPLEQLTGVGYGAYLGTTALDMATLNKSGALNSTIEDFAKQQRALYGLGQVNTTRMIAASMLGVFDSVYTPTTDAAGAYYNTANKILRGMQGQSAEQQASTLYWATNLDSYMGGLIRSAMLLGETDVRNLTDPTRSGMYWRPLSGREEATFRRTQYEYGSATQQLGFSKMRLGNAIWEAIGKDLYNGFNRLVDAAAGGDWKGVLEEARNMWEMLKQKVKSVWDSITGGKEGGSGFWGKFAEGFNKASEAVVSWGAKIAKTIISVWDDIFLAVLKKAQGLISYLSTVHLGIVKDKNSPLGFSFQLSSIKDAPGLNYDEQIFNERSSTMGAYSVPKKGMEGLAMLAMKVLPNKNAGLPGGMGQGLYQNITPRELMYLLGQRYLFGDEALDLPEYKISGWKGIHEDEYRDLLEAIYKADNWAYGDTKMAAMYSSKYARKYITEDTGFYQIAHDVLKNELEPMVNTMIDDAKDSLTIRLEISDSSGAVKHSMDVNKGNVADSGFLTWLQDLLPDNLRLKVVTH